MAYTDLYTSVRQRVGSERSWSVTDRDSLSILPGLGPMLSARNRGQVVDGVCRCQLTFLCVMTGDCASAVVASFNFHHFPSPSCQRSGG